MNGCQISPKGSQVGPKAPNTAPLRRKKKGGLGYILNWLKGDQSKRQQAEGKITNSGISTIYVTDGMFRMNGTTSVPKSVLHFTRDKVRQGSKTEV